MKKVLIITYYWPPAGGAGVQRWLKLSKYLSDYGIAPFVLTVDPDAASYAVRDASLGKEIPATIKVFPTRTSEPFNFYKKLFRKKNIPYAGFANETNPGLMQKLARAVRGNLFIPDARIGWNKFAIQKASELIENEKIDTVITTSPPHSTQLIGLSLKEKYSVCWIADMRDPWTDIYYYNEFYHSSFARKKDLALEKKVIESCDRLIVASPPWKELFQSKTTKSVSTKTTILTNGYDEADFSDHKKNTSDEFVITYSGTIADSYDIRIFIETLQEIILENKTIKFKLRFVGKMSEGIFNQLKRSGLSSMLEILPEVPHQISVDYLMESNALLLVVPEAVNKEVIIPGKLFEYLASRKPIICLGPPDGSSAKILEECEAGKAFGNSMKGELKTYLQNLVDRWKTDPDVELSGTMYQKYSRKTQAGIVAGLIKNQF